MSKETPLDHFIAYSEPEVDDAMQKMHRVIDDQQSVFLQHLVNKPNSLLQIVEAFAQHIPGAQGHELSAKLGEWRQQVQSQFTSLQALCNDLSEGVHNFSALDTRNAKSVESSVDTRS